MSTRSFPKGINPSRKATKQYLGEESDDEMDADEKELLESVESGEWRPAKGGKRERTRYSRYARATFRKDRRLNIRLSSKDLERSRSGRSRRGCLTSR
jgi:predicted DNA binding CopG/RHH family protein